MNHLISDMGREFEGELGECMDAHGIRRYFTGSKTRIHGELGEERPHQLLWILTCSMGSLVASLELPDHPPEFGRRMSWLWAARRAFETMGVVVDWCSSKRSHTGL